MFLGCFPCLQWEMTHSQQPTWFQWGSGKQQPPSTGQWALVFGIWNQNTEMPCVLVFLSLVEMQAWDLSAVAMNLPCALENSDNRGKPSRRREAYRKIGTWHRRCSGPHHLPLLDPWDPTVSLSLKCVKCTSVLGFIPTSAQADLWVFLL